MTFSPRHISLILLLAISITPQLTWGLDCSNEDNVVLRSQDDINNFQSTYGNGGTCDTFKGSLSIVDGQSDITDLSGLLDIIEITGNLYITYNHLLTNVDGLSSLTKLGYSLQISSNSVLADIDGLSSLTSIRSQLNISYNTVLTELNGLSSITSVGGNLEIYSNDALTNVDGLFSLTNAGSSFGIRSNASLTNVDGLSSLTSIGYSLHITDNISLTNVDGLSSLTNIGSDLNVKLNSSLERCEGLSRLLDQWDDLAPGPGPGGSGIPDVGGDVIFEDNLTGCNSIEEIFPDGYTSRINPGLNDAWYNPITDGQGFFITVFPDLGAVSLAWFTYDTEFPAEDATANLGDPGHRWLTAVGPIVGNQAIMEIEMTSGGLFDTNTLIDRTDPPGSDGTIRLTFTSCNSATVEYDIPSINKQGVVPIRRVANDNIVICEALSTD